MLASKTVIKQVAQPTALGPALKPSRGFFGGPEPNLRLLVPHLFRRTPADWFSGVSWWFTWWLRWKKMFFYEIFKVVSLRVGSVVTSRSSCCKLWKCQTCRLTVASRACVINWTSHGTPNKGSYPSAMRKTSALPTMDNKTNLDF